MVCFWVQIPPHVEGVWQPRNGVLDVLGGPNNGRKQTGNWGDFTHLIGAA